MLSLKSARVAHVGYMASACVSCYKSKLMAPKFSTESKDSSEEEKLGGFAKAFLKHSAKEELDDKSKNMTFAALLRNSKFVDLGDPQNKVVEGTIFHVVNDDLYIDFGWKFHCVCPRPVKRGSEYVRGATVRLRVNDLEMSSRFLGASKDLTLLEADCTLLGIRNSPARQ